MASAYRGTLYGRSQRSEGGVAGSGEETCSCKVLLPVALSSPERVGPRVGGFSGTQGQTPETGSGEAAEELAGGQLRALFCTP